MQTRFAERPTPGLCAIAVFLMVMTPLLAYLAPKGFASLLALVGLLAIPGLSRLRLTLAPISVLAGIVVWSLVSLAWSPAAPHMTDLQSAKAFERFTALKLVFQLGLYGTAVFALGGLSRGSARRVGQVMVVGVVALALITCLDGALKAAIYQVLHQVTGDPLRPDQAVVKVSMGTYALALLFWPCARLLDASEIRGRGILIAALAACALAGAHFTSADSSAAALLMGGLAWLGVRTLGKPFAWGLLPAVALYFLLAPLVVRCGVRSGLFGRLHATAPPSWDMRLNIWAFATDQIGRHPLRGWGIDASRTFGAPISLHTHDAALQLWLELGLVGATLAAAFFGWIVYRIVAWTREDRRDGAMAAATLVAYLTIGGVSFGIWQEWWLALGALAVIACGLPRLERGSPVLTGR